MANLLNIKLTIELIMIGDLGIGPKKLPKKTKKTNPQQKKKQQKKKKT